MHLNNLFEKVKQSESCKFSTHQYLSLTDGYTLMITKVILCTPRSGGVIKDRSTHLLMIICYVYVDVFGYLVGIYYVLTDGL